MKKLKLKKGTKFIQYKRKEWKNKFHIMGKRVTMYTRRYINECIKFI